MNSARNLQSFGPSQEKWWGEYLAQYMFAARHIRGQSVLDIGCAWGYGSRYLFDAGASEVVGVDFDPTKIRVACERWARDGVTYLCHDGHTDIGKPESFETVVCFRVMETSRNPDALLRQIFRVLKRGGTLYISTTNRIQNSSLQEAPLFVHHLEEFDHLELQELLRRQFNDVELFGQVCTRPTAESLFGDRASVLDFVKGRLENYVPWQIRQKVSESLLGVSYYPEETEYILRKQLIDKAPILYAICKK